jgi:pyoverdine/dityrosine biosynthesis protein Dit1
MVARSEQHLNFLPQGAISPAGSIQKDEALMRRQFQRFLQQIANVLPAFPCHDSALLSC